MKSIFKLTFLCMAVVACDTFKQDAIPTQKFAETTLVVLPKSSAVVNLKEGLESFGPVTISAAKSPGAGSITALNDYLIKYQAFAKAGAKIDQFVYSVYNSDNVLIGQRIYNVNLASDTTNLACGIYSFPDSVVTGENEPITINVLDNDVFCSLGKSDVVMGMDLPASHGLTEIDYPVIRYYPSTAFRGTDQLVYTLMDKNNVYSSALVTITVDASAQCPFQAVDDKYDLSDSSIQQTTYALAVQRNDRKCNSNLTGFAIVSAPQTGTVSIAGDLLLYVPGSNATGFDSLRYEVCSAAAGKCSSALVLIKLK